MTLAAGWVFLLVVIATVLFLMERWSPDLIGLLVMGALLATGVLKPQDAFAGFSSNATVTVAAMFVLSAGLYRTGALGFAGRWLGDIAERSQWGGLALLLVVAGLSSSVLNNTAVMAIFLPISLDVAKRAKISPSRLLLPLSYAIICGGICTLIGSSSNLVVSGIAARSGLKEFGIFEITPGGFAALAVAIVYLLVVGVRLITERRGADGLAEAYGMHDYLTEVYLREDEAVKKLEELDVQILAVYRNKGWLPGNTPPQRGDQLRIVCDVESLGQLRGAKGMELRPDAKLGEDNGDEELHFVEAVVAPGSEMDGASLKSTRFYDRFGAKVLAIRQRGQVLHEKTSQQQLRGGDALLVEGDQEELRRLTKEAGLVLMSSVDAQPVRPGKRILSAAIVIAVVLSAAFDLAPMVVAATLGVLALVVTQCITLAEAYEAIEWKVIFLLGSMMALGLAMEQTGGAKWLAQGLDAWGPMAALAGVLMLTAMLTETMANNAAAALMAPLAILAAKQLDVDARPFLLAVTYACSLSFILPAGYQTHMMIFEPGHYRTSDFVKVGGPLKVLLCILFVVLIPIFWPLR